MLKAQLVTSYLVLDKMFLAQNILRDALIVVFSRSWSYGVLLWEIVTLGKYSDYSHVYRFVENCLIS